MTARTCPHCRSENAERALLCVGCGRLLVVHDTQPSPLDTAPMPISPGSVWIDDLGSPAPPAPAPPAPAARPAVAPAAPADAESVAAQRAQRRAAVRRSRQRSLAAAQEAGPAVPEVLVVDADPIERGILVGLLQAFGFATYSVPDAAQARALRAEHRFAAIFADIALDASDGGAGIELVREARGSATPVPVFLVSAPPSPVDRVRAQLIGIDDCLDKRVSRGSVAGALDRHGIALPSDARRA